jgi:hypothetical protein
MSVILCCENRNGGYGRIARAATWAKALELIPDSPMRIVACDRDVLIFIRAPRAMHEHTDRN